MIGFPVKKSLMMSLKDYAVRELPRPNSGKIFFYCFITYRAKLLNADWLKRKAFFLNLEGTFGNQEGMIT